MEDPEAAGGVVEWKANVEMDEAFGFVLAVKGVILSLRAGRTQSD